MINNASTRVCITGLTLLALSGCGEDPSTKAVSDAAAIMDVQHVEDATQTYASIISLLDSVSESASPGTLEAANVLQGAAKSGLAITKAQECLTLEFMARELGTVVRATSTKWQRLDAQARAAAQISVDQELAEVAQLIIQRRGERENYLEANASYEAQVSALDTQIESFLGKAAEQRNEAGTLQLQISRVTAVEAAALAERIREFTLRADEFDRRASELSTARDQITPEAREAMLNVEKIESQLQLLDRQRAEAQAREQAAKEDASNARQAADVVASELRNSASELLAFVDGELMDSFDAVNREINAAKQATRQARDITRNSSGLTTTIILQTEGIMESRRSAALAETARAFVSIDAAGAMADASVTAESLNTRALEAHQASNDAYTAAASALRGVRLSSREFRDVADRLNETADILDRLAQTPFGEIPDLAAPPVEPEESFDDGEFFEDESPDEESAELDEI